MTGQPRADPATAGEPDDPFARLVQELLDLDYTRVASVGADAVSYRMATASDLLATIERTGATGSARLTALAADGTHRWDVTCTATTPPQVQVLLLYAVLLADAGDEQDVLRSVADTLGVDLHAEPTDPAGPPAS
ncbi:hypothetical protein O7627_33470 [Solwaraspora sp. WMMD1047]|uniref:hypothetical protein n=1 Tax=Solwaraspora sp. WMMD1047 TaxID=3016102 RepID=UPI002417FD2C|nr:hypothetical protein [Solwaraspora sp. WMMD1047]MDG4834177.1 hypothetical protein [Solwaraspora sp. WMMD1047]